MRKAKNPFAGFGGRAPSLWNAAGRPQAVVAGLSDVIEDSAGSGPEAAEAGRSCLPSCGPYPRPEGRAGSHCCPRGPEKPPKAPGSVAAKGRPLPADCDADSPTQGVASKSSRDGFRRGVKGGNSPRTRPPRYGLFGVPHDTDAAASPCGNSAADRLFFCPVPAASPPAAGRTGSSRTGQAILWPGGHERRAAPAGWPVWGAAAAGLCTAGERDRGARERGGWRESGLWRKRTIGAMRARRERTARTAG